VGFGDTAFEEAALGCLTSESEGAPVGLASFGGPAEPAAKVGAGRMREMASSPRASSASISATPASGPSRMAMATARFSSITGEGST